MNLLHTVLIVAGVGVAWLVVALVIGRLERGREQSRKDAEDHNGD